MRVIAGKAKGLKLNSPPGLDTRPTTDRIKETLFNLLGQDMHGCRFLDLFSGSGGIGIEALSRGAVLSIFVENNPSALKVIKGNLSHSRLGEGAKIISRDVFVALDMLKGEAPFDYIFMDPPYEIGLEEKVLEALSKSPMVNQDTIIIVEAASSTDFAFIKDLNLKLVREKDYKSNKHIFLTQEERGA